MELIILTVGGLLCLIPVGFIWYVNLGGFYSSAKRKRAGVSCAMDADCPPGYICRGGHCIPAV